MSKYKKELESMLQHAKYTNSLMPFPYYDTEYIENIKKELKAMEGNKKNYDDLPVVACKYCKSLWIENDDLDNEYCMRCGSVNDTVIKRNIDEYLKWKNKDE